MAFCLLDTASTHIHAIPEWTLVDVTQLLKQVDVATTTPLPAGWETKPVSELGVLATRFGGSAETFAGWTKTKMVAWLRPRQKAARAAAVAAKPCSFYQGYVRIAELLGRYLDDLYARVPFDYLVCEHQPATTRYENIVLESLVVGHAVARGWRVHTLHPGLKYKGFDDLRVPITHPFGRRFRRGVYAALRHEANKICSVAACERLMSQMPGSATWPRMVGGKKDDLADALLVAWAFSRTPGVPPLVCSGEATDRSAAESPELELPAPARTKTSRKRKASTSIDNTTGSKQGRGKSRQA